MANRSYTIDRSKKFIVWDAERGVVSRHVDFYLAQKAVERHLAKGKISNNYKIIPISEHNLIRNRIHRVKRHRRTI
ncbi:MAG: hypothetical protein AABY22_26605 [Nanoarchaeota archaeon]